jgi:lincosamide nucleotidyltransferase A/C/D/E
MPQADMNPSRVVRHVSSLEEAGVGVWLIGGWAIDALLGEQHRPHDDLDVLIPDTDVSTAGRVLSGEGYRGAIAAKGATYLVDAAGHQIDVHVISIRADGTAVYWMEDDDDVWTYPPGALDGRGEVLGQTVRCLSAGMMMLDHTTGYALDAVHQGDVDALSVAFGIPVPAHRTT